MTIAREEKIGRGSNAERANQIQREDSRQKKNDVPALIPPDFGGQTIAGGPDAVLFARADQTKVPNEKQPTDRAINGAECEPHSRFAQFREEQRFEQSARDVEKVVSELERPTHDGQGVQDRARPKYEDDE